MEKNVDKKRVEEGGKTGWKKVEKKGGRRGVEGRARGGQGKGEAREGGGGGGEEGVGAEGEEERRRERGEREGGEGRRRGREEGREHVTFDDDSFHVLDHARVDNHLNFERARNPRGCCHDHRVKMKFHTQLVTAIKFSSSDHSFLFAAPISFHGVRQKDAGRRVRRKGEPVRASGYAESSSPSWNMCAPGGNNAKSVDKKHIPAVNKDFSHAHKFLRQHPDEHLNCIEDFGRGPERLDPSDMEV